MSALFLICHLIFGCPGAVPLELNVRDRHVDWFTSQLCGLGNFPGDYKVSDTNYGPNKLARMALSPCIVIIQSACKHDALRTNLELLSVHNNEFVKSIGVFTLPSNALSGQSFQLPDDGQLFWLWGPIEYPDVGTDADMFRWHLSRIGELTPKNNFDRTVDRGSGAWGYIDALRFRGDVRPQRYPCMAFGLCNGLSGSLSALTGGPRRPSSEEYRNGQKKRFNARKQILIPRVISLLPGRIRNLPLYGQIIFVALFGSFFSVSLGVGSRWLLLFGGRWRLYGGGLLVGSAALWIGFVLLCMNYVATNG